MKLLIRHGGLWLLMFFCWLPSASAQSDLDKVAKIIVTNIGPAVTSEEFVRANIHVKIGDPYFRQTVDKDILGLYSTGFFFNIRVADQFTDQGVILTYILQGKLKLTDIGIEGNTKFSTAALKKKISSKAGDPMDERKLFADAQEIQKKYEKAGYQHTEVKYVPKNVDYEAGRASVTFEIKETPKIRIVDVTFSGAQAFSQKKLRGEIKTRRHWMFSWITRSGVFKADQFEDDKDALADFYRKAGYIDFEIKEVRTNYPSPKRMKIDFVVFEGNLYKVGAVTFKGNKLFTTEQMVAGLTQQHHNKRSKTKVGTNGLEADVGMTFTPEALANDTQAVSDFYGSKGYIGNGRGVNLRVSKIPNTETGTMDLEYEVDEGDKSYVELVKIKGNLKTKDKVIRRELAVSPGDVFDQVRVRLSKQRLEGLDFFEKVDTKTEPTDVPNHKNLVVGVDEKSTGNFTLGAGFNTVESLFGYVEVEQRNFDIFNPPYFTGGGQKFRLKVQLGTELQDYEISFVEPWFLDRKLTLSIDLYHTVQNYQSLYNLYDETRTGARIGLSRALGNDYLIGGISYGIENIGITHVSQNAPDVILNAAGYKLLSRFGASISYDTRNNYQLPDKGQQTQLSGVFTAGDQAYYRLDLKTAWYFKGLAEGHVLELIAKGGVTQKITGDDVPFFDRFKLGGQDSLRGFDYPAVGPRAPTQDGTSYEPIGGDTYWLISAVYSIPIIDRLRMAFFYDIGNVSAKPFSNEGYDVYGRAFAPSSQLPGPPPLFLGPFFAGNTGGYSDNYGIGLRLDIPHLGPLRLDYGIPLHHDAFNGKNGKFQFGVGFRRPL